MNETGTPTNSNAATTLRDLGVDPDLLALLPDHLPFVLKESQGSSGNLPPISGSHQSPAALYVDKTCFWVALDPEDARRYSHLSGVKVAEPSGNQTTWRLIVHPSDTQRAGAAAHLREAVGLSIGRSVSLQAAADSGRDRGSTKTATICPVHFEEVPVGSGVCSRCAA